MGTCACVPERESEVKVIPNLKAEAKDGIQSEHDASEDAETAAAESDGAVSAEGSCERFESLELLPPSGPSSQSLESVATSPDFNGTWMCSRVEGDWDEFLRDRGTPWAMRKVAKGLDYGVGKQMQIIIHKGDELEILNCAAAGPPREERCFIKADGSEHKVFDPDGLHYMQKTRWEGKVLRSEQVSEGGQPSLILQRFMQGHEMCTERMTARGVIVRRFYHRI